MTAAPAAARRGSPARAALVAAALVALALACVLASPLRRHLDAPVYDLLSTIAPPLPAPDIVVAAIDEPSFAEIGKQWPWPRSLHGDLVRALRAAGARIIALDMVFAEPSAPDQDKALADAMGPDVVLAADETIVDMAQASQTIRVDPLPEFTDRGATAGVVAIALDLDGALRRRPAIADGFAEAVANKVGGLAAHAPERGLIRFRGGPRTYRTISYYQALDPKTFLPPDALEDKIVFVGLSTQTAASASAGGADAFATSYTTRDGRLLAGVEAQATLFDALRSGDLVRPAPLWAEFLALGLAAAAGAGLARGGRGTWRSSLGAAAVALATVAASWLALDHARFWLSPAAPVLAVLLAIAADAALDYARERRARREIAHAFGQYLPPELVARLAADPSALKLGGEARTLSILFCDVRGFTRLAEGMKDDPERLTRLINRLLQPLSDAVLNNGGTIDKYIGDCVMAFWNAPLDAPDHAEKAVAAGLDMLEGVKALNAELASEAPPGVVPLSFAVGVGINTGECVVGNLGSEKRFDYTAVGDAVNLASRLESASRFYGVALLVGEETAARAAGRFRFVELDRVAVKGRSGGLAVFTTLGEAEGESVAAAQARFLVSYRAEDWAGARDALDEVRAAAPRLALYAVGMKERIATLESSPPPADWGGVFSASEK